jgi:hypothetical protein
MKKSIIASMALLALTACQNSGVSKEQELSYLLENPLFAERYSEAMVDTMVELEIYEDPIIQDEAKMKIIDKTKEDWLKVAKKSRADQRKGSKGSFTPITEFTAGEVLYSEGSLFLAPDFASAPGPSLHFYLSAVVDPRDGDFPDESAIDLGLMRSNLGTGRYEVITEEDPIKYRSLVLFDTELERLYGFAQISPLYK